MHFIYETGFVNKDDTLLRKFIKITEFTITFFSEPKRLAMNTTNKNHSSHILFTLKAVPT